MDNLDYCYWIAVPGRMARIDCNREMINLPKSRDLPENEILEPYKNELCPYCGKPIRTDDKSYSLIDNWS